MSATISRAERNFIFATVSRFGGIFGALPRDQVVGSEEGVVFWTATCDAALAARVEVEETAARRARKDDERRGIPAGLTFKAANAAKEDLRYFRRKLEEIREEAERKASERAAKEAAAEGGQKSGEAAS
jgi:hypothetical protein